MTPEPTETASQPRPATRQMASCGGCTARWRSLNYAHCATCHRTFGGITGFDRHRRRGKCLDPATIAGFVCRHDVWRQALPPDARRRLGIPDGR